MGSSSFKAWEFRRSGRLVRVQQTFGDKTIRERTGERERRFVILSEAKNLRVRRTRFFASLRMTNSLSKCLGVQGVCSDGDKRYQSMPLRIFPSLLCSSLEQLQFLAIHLPIEN